MLLFHSFSTTTTKKTEYRFPFTCLSLVCCRRRRCRCCCFNFFFCCMYNTLCVVMCVKKWNCFQKKGKTKFYDSFSISLWYATDSLLYQSKWKHNSHTQNSFNSQRDIWIAREIYVCVFVCVCTSLSLCVYACEWLLLCFCLYGRDKRTEHNTKQWQITVSTSC